MPTVWNTNREPPATIEAARRALMAGEMPLPPGPVPDVHPLPDSAAQRRAPQKGSGQAKIIDGVAKNA